MRESAHWGYTGEEGPDHWGKLSTDDMACSAGSQQSPVDLTGAIGADLPKIEIDWASGPATVVNNGHTIQINVADDSMLRHGADSYTLLQFHFHAPSEHLVDGKAFPMEAHFVHKNVATGGLGVMIQPGGSNDSFAMLAAKFPGKPNAEAKLDVDPSTLLPGALDYWAYAGSLTPPPFSEVVD